MAKRTLAELEADQEFVGQQSLFERLERIASIPLELREGEQEFVLPPIPQPKAPLPPGRDPKVPVEPGSDGYIRRQDNLEIVPDQTTKAPWNKDARDLFIEADRAMRADRNYRLAELVAGELNKPVTILLDVDQSRQEIRIEAEAKQRAELEKQEARKTFGEGQQQLKLAREDLDRLRERRSLQQSLIAEPARKWLTEDRLGALLELWPHKG